MSAHPRRALLLVENLSVPRDKRVWPEALALAEAGYEVVAICPQDRQAPEPFERLGPIEIHRYPLVFSDGGAAGYLREYAWAFVRTARLVRRLARTRRFDVVHAANPPDLLLFAALPLKLRGTRFVFDHHDLVPELYACRFGGASGPLYWLARVVEWLAFRVADVVISTNESYRELAVGRGGKRPEDVFVVRNAPGSRIRPTEPEPALKRGRPFLLAYVGVMGQQDGGDLALRALAQLRERRGDWHAVFAGDGDALPELQALAHRLGLDDAVDFLGWIEDDGVRRVLASADVCLAPEPRNPLNDVSTLIKVAEYMAMARPVVAFDLRESRFTAGQAALYAEPNDPGSFADCIEQLLDDADLRTRMGELGRERVANGLTWESSKRTLLAAYEHALGTATPGV
jgi:glycosyltransferase involved in cell wall biosynthesis